MTDNAEYVKRLQRTLRHLHTLQGKNDKLEKEIFRLELELDSTRRALMRKQGFNA